MTDQTVNPPYVHGDGRVCRWLRYALETRDSMGFKMATGELLWGYFYGLPPDMRRCHRDHPGGADDPAAE